MSTNMYNPSDQRVYPDRWPRYRGKQLFEIIDDKSETGNEELLSVSHITGITPRSQKTVNMFQSESLIGYKRVQVGDIAANTMWTWQGAIGVSEYAGVVSPAYNVYRQRGDYFNPKFLDLLLREPNLIDVYKSLSTGIQPSRLRLYPSGFLTIDFPVPPIEEQNQIVRYLDWKVSKINKLIAIRLKQLQAIQELIDKQYESIANEATKTARMKYLVEQQNDFIDIEPDRFYMKTGMYNRGRGIFRREPMLGRDMGDSTFQRIHSGSLMISGQFAWEAAVYITGKQDENGVASHRYYLLDAVKEVPIEYLWCFLMSGFGQLTMQLCSHGAAGRNRPLNIRELLNTYIPIPNSGKDLDALVNNVRQLMKMRGNIVEQRKKLGELRSRLVADIVTGTVDVMGINVPERDITDADDLLFEEDEDESLDESED